MEQDARRERPAFKINASARHHSAHLGESAACDGTQPLSMCAAAGHPFGTDSIPGPNEALNTSTCISTYSYKYSYPFHLTPRTSGHRSSEHSLRPRGGLSPNHFPDDGFEVLHLEWFLEHR